MIMDRETNKVPLNENVAQALTRLTDRGKNTFRFSDWTDAVGGNRIRACQYLKELRADGRVARVAEDAYVIV